ncbi:hypothetical protein TREES_T100006249 [Tupaia chinensis]|uniref:Uncharacterized protein n=1 Tax=Tupaia chinensis TaxID=246437 RepID=L9LA39_TUPCH|nr:hypothetical protein TREES_T100006249 [Tupaia chinensis]
MSYSVLHGEEISMHREGVRTSTAKEQKASVGGRGSTEQAAQGHPRFTERLDRPSGQEMRPTAQEDAQECSVVNAIIIFAVIIVAGLLST